MKLAIFDTEGLGEAIDDYAEATGSDPVVFGAAWAKAKGLSHGSPDALIAAMRECEKDPEIFALLVDAARKDAEEHPGRWSKADFDELVEALTEPPGATEETER